LPRETEREGFRRVQWRSRSRSRRFLLVMKIREGVVEVELRWTKK